MISRDYNEESTTEQKRRFYNHFFVVRLYFNLIVLLEKTTMYSNQLISVQPPSSRNNMNGKSSGIQSGGYPRFTLVSYINPFVASPPVVPSIYPCKFVYAQYSAYIIDNNFSAYTVAYCCEIPYPEVVGVQMLYRPTVAQNSYLSTPTSSASTSPSTHPCISNETPSPMSDSHRGSFSEPLIECLPDMESTVDTTVSVKSETKTTARVRNAPKYWKKDECDRLRKAISMYGSHGQWKLIAHHVGTRTENQCINKWKNDLCKHGNRKRWNADASRQLEKLLKLGLDVKAIQDRMPAYTYIQIYQQIEKRKKRRDEWKSWEIEKLKELKSNGVHSFTEIGNLLNNRHCDDVKNMWKKICSSSF